jgi:hypothetical protein
VNPGNPTPSGFGFQLPNPEKSGKLVYYDDCEQATGTMIEAKGPEYAGLLTFEKGRDSVATQFLDQSAHQVAGARLAPPPLVLRRARDGCFCREALRKSR